MGPPAGRHCSAQPHSSQTPCTRHQHAHSQTWIAAASKACAARYMHADTPMQQQMHPPSPSTALCDDESFSAPKCDHQSCLRTADAHHAHALIRPQHTSQQLQDTCQRNNNQHPSTDQCSGARAPQAMPPGLTAAAAAHLAPSKLLPACAPAHNCTCLRCCHRQHAGQLP
jgi:hypothetical protein